MMGKKALRVAVGAGLVVLGLAALGGALSVPAEPRRLRAEPGGRIPLPPAPEGPVTGEIRRENVRLPVRGEVLGGTVYAPDGDGRHPAVVLVHGAGPRPRARLSEVAEHFARSGIVALAYDKRTVGYSTVTERDFGLLADDALVAAGFLRRRADVRPGMVGLWGISEGGGWVVPLAASRAPDDVAFVVLVSAPAVSPKRQLIWGTETGLEHAKAPSGFRDAAVRAVGMGGFGYVDHDPLPSLERTGQPLLAVYGAQDAVVPVAQSARLLAAALRRGGNNSYDIRFFPGADHGMRLGGGELAPGYLRGVEGWIHGLPNTTEAPPGTGISGEVPFQRLAAGERPAPPPYATGGALAVAFGLAAAGYLAGPVAALLSRRVRRTPGASKDDAGASWREVRPLLRWLAISGISTQVLFNLALGVGIALALTRVGSWPVPNIGWLVVRLVALATVVLAVAALDASWAGSARVGGPPATSGRRRRVPSARRAFCW